MNLAMRQKSQVRQAISSPASRYHVMYSVTAMSDLADRLYSR